MVQAWDFVDASVLWQSRSEFLNVEVMSIDFGVRHTPRIQHACSSYVEWRLNGRVHKPIVTVADMVALHETEWLRMPNFGHKSLAAMKRVLAEHGLELAQRR